jgi:hypothetical protein
MAIVVLAGSPKGSQSVTAEYVRYLAARRPDDTFSFVYPAGSLSTSIHFYDHTAHNYIHGVCDDLGMRYLGAFAAEMHDLLDAGTRKQLVRWFSSIQRLMLRGDRPARRYAPLDLVTPEYRSAGESAPPVAAISGANGALAPRVTIVTDGSSHDADRAIDELAVGLTDALEADLHPPVTFRGGAGGVAARRRRS